MARLKFWLPFALIPIVAIFIASRQLYLSKFYNLSTWKGGGMGMFASADIAQRYVRIFVEMPGRPRILVRDLSPELNELVRYARFYPSDENFDRVGQLLRRTRFRANREPAQIWKFDQSGERQGVSEQFYIVATAESELGTETEQDWQAVIEFSELSYDPVTRLLKTSIAKTRRYGPDQTGTMSPKL